ncbi:MAG: hypothetical protein WCZ23_12800 [Rhodospirillaceae bacterium]
MRSLLTAAALAVAAVVTLSACTTEPPPARAFAELRFTNQAPLSFGAQGPEIINNFRPPMGDPHVEHLMPLPPEKAIRTWVGDRLQASGVGNNTLRVTINNASVTETPLDTKGGVRGFFTDQQELRYDARADVVVQIIDMEGRVRAEAVSNVWRSRTLGQKASLAERERLWFELVERLMLDLDSQLTTGLRQHFREFLISG